MLNRPVPKSSKLGYLGLIVIVVIGAILLPMGSNSIAEAANSQKNSHRNSETKTIVPGVRVGDSEQKIKQAFGEDFQLEEAEGKDFLTYEDKGLHFEIHKKNRTVMEITVNQTTGNHVDSDAHNSDKAIMLSE